MGRNLNFTENEKFDCEEELEEAVASTHVEQQVRVCYEGAVSLLADSLGDVAEIQSVFTVSTYT